MKPEELHFGNLALFDGEVITIASQNAIDSAAYLEPLPITSALMTQKHGYGYQITGASKAWMLNEGLMIEVIIQLELNCCWLLVGNAPLQKYVITYYHKLQNLYREHAGAERMALSK